ncbi:formate dehydrogenase accessory sulfurtransferase FdhD [Xylanibacillus composti]|uniref:Sulfur carrier protein FdhD n=1 Tax=Xylanibacillus composti TaxID=1572762 RepID=A0A8J4H182_9BACL|nr:formate dehydrogenase accessory sulfurtransferase FdhD [Xylanibacillus composti]GIQ67726.1 sulfurtransferase FdhD [Xylanibacillus composti]
MHKREDLPEDRHKDPGSSNGLASWQTVKWSGQAHASAVEIIAEEKALTLYVNEEEFATVLCSPLALEPLVYGFLASEGVIRTAGEVKQVRIDPGRGTAHISLHAPLSPDKRATSKRFVGSCCGKSREFYFQHDVRTAKTFTRQLNLSAAACYRLMEWLEANSSGFAMTGGLHNAGLCTVEKGLFVHSDIGRHNALDKVFGTCLMEQIPAGDKIIAFSGRLSSEVILKAAKIGVGAIISRSAPTDLALRLAKDLGMTAVGFARSGQMNAYTHGERIQADVESRE